MLITTKKKCLAITLSELQRGTNNGSECSKSVNTVGLREKKSILFKH